MLCIKISNSVYTVKIYSFFISDLRQKGQLTVLTKNTFWSQNVSFGEIVARFIKSLQKGIFWTGKQNKNEHKFGKDEGIRGRRIMHTI